MRWLDRKSPSTHAPDGRSNLSFEGKGSVSVPVSTIVNSPKVQAQVQAVKQIARQAGKK
jgi:hypothetical protein